MKSMSRKVQLGLVAVFTAATMFTTSSLAASQSTPVPNLAFPKICIKVKWFEICVGGKVAATQAEVLKNLTVL
jgi:hypothetical protein